MYPDGICYLGNRRYSQSIEFFDINYLLAQPDDQTAIFEYHNRYPLIEWGWSRTDCVRALEAAGLPQPGKSSCFFCPSMKREEIMLLKEQHPDLYARAIAIEDNARPRLEKVKGLGRNYAWKDRFGKE